MESLCSELWQQLKIKNEIEQTALRQSFSAPRDLATIWGNGCGHIFLLPPNDRHLSEEQRAVLKQEQVQKLYVACLEHKFDEITHSVHVSRAYENYVMALRGFIAGTVDRKRLRGFEDDLAQNMKNSEYPPALRLGFELIALAYRYLIDPSQFVVILQIKRDYLH